MVVVIQKFKHCSYVAGGHDTGCRGCLAAQTQCESERGGDLLCACRVGITPAPIRPSSLPSMSLQ